MSMLSLCLHLYSFSHTFDCLFSALPCPLCHILYTGLFLFFFFFFGVLQYMYPQFFFSFLFSLVVG